VQQLAGPQTGVDIRLRRVERCVDGRMVIIGRKWLIKVPVEHSV
jgi:hypothetical protein